MAPRTERRADALSKQRIVDAAIAILDDEGEAALTFRALTTRLATGSGAIYWHVANKHELLVAATDGVVAHAVDGVVRTDDPHASVRAIASGVFDALEAHPWLGAQLSREPWQSASTQLFDALGQQVQALGVADDDQFHAASALLSYVLGLAAQHAAAARLPADADRSTFLTGIADRWTEEGADRYPFAARMAARLADHDDREQFLAGIDLLLTGITARR